MKRTHFKSVRSGSKVTIVPHLNSLLFLFSAFNGNMFFLRVCFNSLLSVTESKFYLFMLNVLFWFIFICFYFPFSRPLFCFTPMNYDCIMAFPDCVWSSSITLLSAHCRDDFCVLIYSGVIYCIDHASFFSDIYTIFFKHDGHL